MRIEFTNQVPPMSLGVVSATKTQESKVMTEEERQEALLSKLNLSGLESWAPETAAKVQSLLLEYNDIFLLAKSEIGHTKAVEHKIVLKDPDTQPLKKHFGRIPPAQVDDIQEHLKLMLDAGAIRPSNSPRCNAVMLVQKRDGTLCFCIDFRRLSCVTRNNSHPLSHICETLDSLVGSAYYSTFDLTSGFWQVPMAEESKQYTAFTLGSMGFFECDRMAFGLSNTPATFQRLMQN